MKPILVAAMLCSSFIATEQSDTRKGLRREHYTGLLDTGHYATITGLLRVVMYPGCGSVARRRGPEREVHIVRYHMDI